MLKISTPAQYIILLIDLVEKQGCDRAALLRGTSLARTGIGGIGARVGAEDFARLVANAQALTGDALLGLKLGLRLNLSTHAVLGQAFLTCKDLAQVMDLFRRYYHLLAPGMSVDFENNGDRCLLTITETPLDSPPQFTYELLFAGMLNTLQGLLNRPELRLRMEFPYPRPASIELYSQVFGDDIHFAAARARISWPASLMAATLPSSSPALLAMYEQECSRLLADLEEEDSVAEQTLHLLRKLEGQYPSMPQIAQMLNVSARTYRRRLEAEGKAYQVLLDRVRAEHATYYLKHTRLPLSSISYMMGFNDASNFRRAYLRWTGKSPLVVRRS